MVSQVYRCPNWSAGIVQAGLEARLSRSNSRLRRNQRAREARNPMAAQSAVTSTSFCSFGPRR